MNVLSLFSGIGGLDLGLERAGMTVVGFVERDPYCRRVLAKHWPEVPQHDDVATAVGWWASEPRPPVHVVAGGFPCQPFSSAGQRRGIGDERWGWPWMAAVVDALRPEYVITENVAALLRDIGAMSIILVDLANLGFDVEWSVVSACAVGAPHTRRRLFMVAHPDSIDGLPRLGAELQLRQPAYESRRNAARAWRCRVDGALAASRSDDRGVDGLARAMVAAGGNAVVPQVAEHIGHLVMQAAS